MYAPPLFFFRKSALKLIIPPGGVLLIGYHPGDIWYYPTPPNRAFPQKHCTAWQPWHQKSDATSRTSTQYRRKFAESTTKKDAIYPRAPCCRSYPHPRRSAPPPKRVLRRKSRLPPPRKRGSPCPFRGCLESRPTEPTCPQERLIDRSSKRAGGRWKSRHVKILQAASSKAVGMSTSAYNSTYRMYTKDTNLYYLVSLYLRATASWQSQWRQKT